MICSKRMRESREERIASEPRPQFTHVDLFARDIEKIIAFYTNVFGLTVTDQGGNPADL